MQEIISKDAGISVRRPNNKFLLKLIKKVDKPIVSTSLNITGKKDLKNISKIDNYFQNIKPDVVVDAGKLLKNKASENFYILHFG